MAHRAPYTDLQTQRGAALLIMMVIMVVGILAVLIGSLNSSAINTSRQQQTAAVLAQAKDALLGYAASDSNRPGELPCPDVNGDGWSLPVDEYIGNNCVQLLGRLPWKTLGLPDLRDGNSEPLWYAVSNSFHANGNTVINSDTIGTLSINGTQSITNIAAIIFAPGAPQCGQSHANNNVAQYLEAMSSVTATSAVAATPSNDCNNAPYNDNLIPITRNQLIQAAEQRIAREVKICLDGYAAGSANKYPWAAPVTDLNYVSTPNTYFGRIPAQPNINTGGGSTQAALEAALSTAGNAVVALRNLVSSVSSAIDTAGDWAIELSNGQHTVPSVQTKIDNAMNAVNSLSPSSKKTQLLSALNALQAALDNFATGPGVGSTDATMLASWASVPACNELFTASYWPDWHNFVFYQVDDKYRPNGSATGNGSIKINGSGAYRAAIALGRSPIGAQNHNNPTLDPPSNFLEGLNPHPAIPILPQDKTFETYRPTNAGYTNINDYVLCLDGNTSCQ